MTTWRRWFSALALMLVFAAAASAQRSMIRGKVRTPSGSPVNNAIVELRIGGSGMIGQTVTRNDGDFAFTELEPGTSRQPGEYEVSVNMGGFEPAAQTVRFDSNNSMKFMQVVNVEIIIRPKVDAA
ncbi:MAG: Carboxypeptidase regulatory-like domain, partial [Blastocatellia bacterium]